MAYLRIEGTVALDKNETLFVQAIYNMANDTEAAGKSSEEYYETLAKFVELKARSSNLYIADYELIDD